MQDHQTVTQYVVTNGDVPPGQRVFTPDGFKDIAIEAITPFGVILARGIIAYLTAFLGLVIGGISAAGVGYPVVSASNVKELILKCALMAGATTGVVVLKNIYAQLSVLGERFPILKV